MLRAGAIFIAAICLAPLALVLAAWWLPWSLETKESWNHVVQNLMSTYVLQTLLLCLGVSIVSGIFGVTSAWLTTHFSFQGQRVLEWALILPLAVPAYISAYCYGWLLEYAGPVQSGLRELMGWSRGDYWFPEFRSLLGAIWVLGLATTPYVYLLAKTAFRSQPQEWWEASATLGSHSTSFFYKIALPAARPFIATGTALAMMETVADIGTVTVMGVQTMSSGIYRSWFYMGEPLISARLSGLLLVFVFTLMGLEAFGRRRMKFSSLRNAQAHKRVSLTGTQAVVAFVGCALPFILGFLFPVLILFRLLSYSTSFEALHSVGDYLFQTTRLGVITGLLATGAAYVMVSAERFHAQWMRVVSLLANLGYAIPGAVVAVGLMILFGWLRESLQSNWILTGSILGLLIAYTVRFLATAYSPLHSGMLRIPEELDWASASLGQSRFGTILKVHRPLLTLSLCSAFVVVFLDTVKELPATLILRPFDVKTLAVAAFEFASDDRHIEAAPYSLVLIGLSTVAVLFLHVIQEWGVRWRHVER